MFPFFPFIAGVLTGAAVLRLAKSGTTQAGLDKAQTTLRSATVSGLEAIEQASGRARQRIAGHEATSEESATVVSAPDSGQPEADRANLAPTPENAVAPKIRRARVPRPAQSPDDGGSTA